MSISFYCPKCGEYTINSIGTIRPGVEFSCGDCGSVYSISYDVVFDSDDDAEQKMHPTLGESAASDSESTPARRK